MKEERKRTGQTMEMKEKPAITIEFSNAAYCFSSFAAKDDEEIGPTEPLVKMQSNCSRECCTGSRVSVRV